MSQQDAPADDAPPSIYGHPYATREAAEWALRATGLTGIDSPVTLAEEDGAWLVRTADPDAAARLDDAPPFQPAADAIARLDILRTGLLRAVDDEAERQRLRWITPGAGQAMTYARKVEEATALKGAAGADDPDAYPMLAAGLGNDGDTLAEVADTVLAKNAAWAVVGAAIERRRLGLKRDIAAATSAAALAAIDIAAGWPEGVG